VIHQPHGPMSARHLTTMRRPLRQSALSTIIEPQVRRPLPDPRRRGPLPRYGFVVAVVAAHDAEDRLGNTLESLNTQTRRPDAVVVVADRCSDATVVVALTHGATVVETEGNDHGCAGGLDLALTEVLAMVDDDDVVLVLGDSVALEAGFVAAGLRQLWATSAPVARWRRRPDPVGAVTAVPGGSSRLGTHWPGGRRCHHPAAVMALAGALRAVAANRGCAPAATGGDTGGVLDVTASGTLVELTTALAAGGQRTITLADQITSMAHDHDHHRLFGAHRDHQQAALSALAAHGCPARPLVTQARLAAEVAAPPLVVGALTAGGVLGVAVAPLLAALAVAGVLWVAERSWSARHAGRRLPLELVRGLARSAWGAAGVVAGTWRWLSEVRWRRVWRHPESGRMLARRAAPFAHLGNVSMVRVPGSPIALERSAPAPDVARERWRRRLLGASCGAIAVVVLAGLPVVAPLPATVLVGAWALATAVVSTGRLTARLIGRWRPPN